MLSTDDTPQLLTVAELAKRLRISLADRLQAGSVSGRMRAYRVGHSDTGALRVDVRELDRLIDLTTEETPQ